MLSHFKGRLVDFEGRRKMLIAPERNKLPSSDFQRSKGHKFLYRIAILEFKIKWKLFSEYRLHHFLERKIYVFKWKMIVEKSIFWHCFI